MTDNKSSASRYVKPEVSEVTVNFDWDHFPDIGRPKLRFVPNEDMERIKRLPEAQQKYELDKLTPMDISLYDFHTYIQEVIEWMFEQINKGLRVQRVKVSSASLNPFDKTHYDERELFKKAYALYMKRGKKRKSYTYIASLDEANEKYRVISVSTYDEKRQNINRNYTNWRKNLRG